MTKPSDSDHARLPLGMRSAFEGVARWPWMASEMGTDDARTTPTHQSHHSAQRVVEKAGRSITNSETPHLKDPLGQRIKPDRLACQATLLVYTIPKGVLRLRHELHLTANTPPRQET